MELRPRAGKKIHCQYCKVVVPWPHDCPNNTDDPAKAEAARAAYQARGEPVPAGGPPTTRVIEAAPGETKTVGPRNPV
jgi:hypothetical protein